MDKSATAIPPTEEQISRGLVHVGKLKGLLSHARARVNKVQEYFTHYRIPRHRRLLYFMARISSERHPLSFEELTQRERLAVIDAMTELREMVSHFPDELLHKDADIH